MYTFPTSIDISTESACILLSNCKLHCLITHITFSLAMKKMKYIIPDKMYTIRVMEIAMSSITCPASVFIRNVLQLGRQMQFLGMNKGWQSNTCCLDDEEFFTLVETIAEDTLFSLEWE